MRFGESHISQMQSTPLEAYYTRVLPCLGYAQTKVYHVLEDATSKGFDMTNAEIGRLLKWPINRVTPRVKELRDEKHVVVKSCIRKCGVTGNRAMAWKALKGRV